MRRNTKLYPDWRCIFFIFLINLFFITSFSLAQEEAVQSSASQSPSSVDSSTSEKTADKSIPVDIVLVLDNSGSMKQNDPEFLVKDVVTAFFEKWRDKACLGLVVFDENARLVMPLSFLDNSVVRDDISKVLSSVDYRGQKTNIAAGVERAIYELKTRGRKGARRACILLTDGHMDLGSPEQDVERERWLREYLAEEAKEKGIRIYGIAFTEDADYPLLQALAKKTHGDYFRAIEGQELKKVFAELHKSLTRKEPKPVAVKVNAKDIGKPATHATNATVSDPASKPVESASGFGVNTILLGVIALAVIGLVLFLFFRRDTQNAVVQQVSSTPSDGKNEEVPEVTIVYLGKDPIVAKNKEDLKSSDPFAPGNEQIFKCSEIRMGRIEGNTLMIQNPEQVISRVHAKIIFKNGEFYLVDLKSTNKTFLNGKRLDVGHEYLLKNGDVFSLYIYKFKFARENVLNGDTTFVVSENDDTAFSANVPSKGSGSSEPPEGLNGQTTSISPEPDKSDSFQHPSSGSGQQEGKKGPEEPSNYSEGSDDSTIAISGNCANHLSKKAVHMCVVCKKGFCKDCVVIENGQAICHECKKKNS